MGFIGMIIVAIGLAMDAFAVSIGVGTTGNANSPRPVFRVSFHMGLFQGLMTFLGWLAGSSIASFISGFDHWIALILLAFVGIRMVKSGLGSEEEKSLDDPSRGGHLMLICIATSIDAMAVGLSFAMLDVDILASCLIIGVVTLVLSLVGLRAGGKLGEHFGKKMEIFGGLLLCAIGLRILFSHLFGG